MLVRGQVSFYENRGDLQIIADHLEPAGEGALLRAFEALKKKLAAEGLFDEHLKRPLPEIPRAIGVITSPTGAALQDILTTLRRRFPLGTVYVYPVPVQGEAAAPAIVKALAELPALAAVDVLILARGGGSMEDLWAFNDERIARAIRACRVPVVVGVGHEIDFTIADFAADLRAPTPTGAAERVSPDVAGWLERLRQLDDSLARAQGNRLQQAHESLHRLRARLDVAHPGRRLQHIAQRLDELGERLRTASPARLAETLRQRLNTGAERLHSRLTERLRDLQHRLRTQAALLQSLGPQAVLERGYAIAQTAGGDVLRDPATVTADERVNLTLARGQLETRVIGRDTKSALQD